MLPILTSSTVLSAPILVGCGQTLKADFVCDNMVIGSDELGSNYIDVVPNKTYTVSIDLSKLNHNKSFNGYELQVRPRVAIVGSHFYFEPSLCQVKIDDGEFKKVTMGQENNIIIDASATYSKIEFIVGFEKERNDVHLCFIDNPE